MRTVGIGLARGVRDLDELVRLHAVGFLALWPLLGASSVAKSPPVGVLVAITVVAVSFNTFGAVLNDVIDLPVDRTAPLRRQTPLVRGVISPRLALALALTQLPLMCALHLLFGGPAGAVPLLLGAAALMGLYDLFSKRCPFPPLIELAQAAAGGMLVFYGARWVGAATVQTVLIAASSAAFILLINGVHGGLRDLDNDRAHGQRTTPIVFGCRHGSNGRLEVSASLAIHALVLELALCALALVSWRLDGADALLVPLLVASAVGIVLLAGILGWRGRGWDALVRLQLLLAPLPILLARFGSMESAFAAALIGVYLAPLLVLDTTYRVWRLPQGATSRPSRSTGQVDSPFGYQE